MFTATFYPDSAPGSPVVLCNTSRSLTEMNVTLNQRRVTEHVAGYGAAFDLAVDRGNMRNLLSFDVRRDADYTPAKFADPEAALLFALDHPGYLPGAGILQINLAGAHTASTNRWLLNCSLEVLDMPDWLGTAPLFRYLFNGGMITGSSPF